jgi:iron(III) transport system permease protein
MILSRAIAILAALAFALCLLPALRVVSIIDATSFSQAFSDPGRSIELATTSLMIAAGTLLLSLGVGVPLGFAAFRSDLPGRRLLITAAIVGACVPLYLSTAAWMTVFDLPFWLNKPRSAMWIQGVAFIPLVMLISGICFRRVDPDLEDLTALDTTAAGVVRHVTLKQAAWGIVIAGLSVLTLTVADITVTDILVIRSYAEETFSQFKLGSGPRRAAAVSLPLIIITTVLLLVLWQLTSRLAARTVSAADRVPRVFPLGGVRVAAAVAAALVCLAFFATPFLHLAAATGGPGNFAKAFGDLRRELLETLITVPATATLATAIALPVAWAMVRCQRWRYVILPAMALLMAVPAPLIGIGIIELLNHPGALGKIYDSRLTLIYGQAVRVLPFAILVLLPAMLAIPQEHEDVARINGATWLQVMTYTVAPMVRSALILAWCLAAVLAVSELGASALIYPPGHTTLTVRFFTLIHYGVYPSVAAMCLMLLTVAAVPAGFIASRLKFDG